MNSYMTKSWKNVKQGTLRSTDEGFALYLRGHSRPAQIAFARIMKAYQGNPSGVEFRHHTDEERWAFVLPDASEVGFRIQQFDKMGFSGHQHYASLDESVDEMVTQGYRIADPGILDLLSTTEAWAQGIAWMEKVRQLGRSYQAAA